MQWRSINQRGSTLLEMLTVLTVCITLTVIVSNVLHQLYKAEEYASPKTETKHPSDETVGIRYILYRKEIPGRTDLNQMSTDLEFPKHQINFKGPLGKVEINHQKWNLQNEHTSILVTTNWQRDGKDATTDTTVITLEDQKQNRCKITPSEVSLRAVPPQPPNQNTMKSVGVTYAVQSKPNMTSKSTRTITPIIPTDSEQLNSVWSALPMVKILLHDNEAIQEFANQRCVDDSPANEQSFSAKTMGRLFGVNLGDNKNQFFICGKKNRNDNFINYAYKWPLESFPVIQATEKTSEHSAQQRYTPQIGNDIMGVYIPEKLDENNYNDVHSFLKEALPRLLTFIVYCEQKTLCPKLPREEIENRIYKSFRESKATGGYCTSPQIYQAAYTYLQNYISKTSFNITRPDNDLVQHKTNFKSISKIINSACIDSTHKHDTEDTRKMMVKKFIDDYNKCERIKTFTRLASNFTNIHGKRTYSNFFMKDILVTIAQQKFIESNAIWIIYDPNIIGCELPQQITEKNAEHIFTILTTVDIPGDDYGKLKKKLESEPYVTGMNKTPAFKKITHKIKKCLFSNSKDNQTNKEYCVNKTEFTKFYNKKNSRLKSVIKRINNLDIPHPYKFVSYIKEHPELQINLRRTDDKRSAIISNSDRSVNDQDNEATYSEQAVLPYEQSDKTDETTTSPESHDSEDKDEDANEDALNGDWE